MHTSGDEKREDPLVDMGYETKDLNISGIAKASIGFFGFIVFSLVAAALIMVWVYNWRAGILARTRPPVTPPPPFPLLQNNVEARTDLMDLRQHEQLILTTKGTNKDGSLRIPVADAMKIIAREGIQAVPATVSGNLNGTTGNSSAQPTTANGTTSPAGAGPAGPTGGGTQQ